MANRFSRCFPLTLLLTALALSGCGTVHGWARGGTDARPAAGASVGIPLGK
jgi:predicted small secreted protein